MGLNTYDDVLKVNKKIYSEYAEEYQNRTKNGHDYLKSFIDEFIARLVGNKVFDLGCGPGRDLAYFIQHELDATGVDCSDGMIEICQKKNLPIIKNDFIKMQYDAHSVDGIWAYTSHTVIPKTEFKKLIKKYSQALKIPNGVLALGMIEGNFEGWKRDSKYDGARRFVSRYTIDELQEILSTFFGTVSIRRVPMENGKVYLHCLCVNNPVASQTETVEATKTLFNRFSQQYLEATTGGVELLRKDRDEFSRLILSKFGNTAAIVDLGCGPGRDVKLFSKVGFKVTGFDVSSENIKKCHQDGYDALQGDLYKLDSYFEENQFCGAWCNCSVTNWLLKSEIPTVIEYIKKIVKPDGYIFIGSVLGSLAGWEIDQKYDGLKRYNNHWDETVLRGILENIGELVYENKLTNTGKKDYLNQVFRNVK